MNKILQIVKKNDIFFRNFTSLSLLQVSNYLFPLITFPYLVRILGPEKYGLVNFVVSFTSFFVILIDFGFNLSATQEISTNRDNKEKINEIFSQVVTAKLFLYVLSSIIFLFCLLTFRIFQKNLLLYILSYLGLIGTVIFPLWYFQGMEKMKFIFLINFIIKLMSITFIFLLIKDSSDLIILILIYSVSQIIYGLTGLLTVMTKFKVKLILMEINKVYNQLIKSRNFFISSVSISIISNSNVFILGLFTNESVVGYFAAADKIRLAIQSFYNPLFSSTFPHVSNIVRKSIKRFNDFNKKSLKFTLTLGIVFFLISYFGADTLVKIVLGSSYNNSVIILKIMSVIPLLYSISNFLGIQLMLPLNYSKEYAFIMLITVFVHTISSILLVNYLQDIGSAIAIILSESFAIISLLNSLFKNKILILKERNNSKL